MYGNITSNHPPRAPGCPGELQSADRSDLSVLSHHLFLKLSLTSQRLFLKRSVEMGDANSRSFAKNLGAF